MPRSESTPWSQGLPGQQHRPGFRAPAVRARRIGRKERPADEVADSGWWAAVNREIDARKRAAAGAAASR
jgi:hypothetical protein